MATTISNKRYSLNDDEDDVPSDTDEWSEMTQRNLSECPDILEDGDYYQPINFHTKPVSYGDSGYMELKYPIWICGGLSKSISDTNTNIREELLEVFYKLNNQRKDFHKHPSPVEDIIDPDLLVCKPIQPPPPPPLLLSPDSRGCYFENETYDPYIRWNYDSSSLRGSYQWIPSEFRICHNENDEYEVHIETPISHLPMTEEYQSTYRNLEKIFAKLVPMFNEILSFGKHNYDIRLQVIVKLQGYNIQPGVKYTGRWHTEGCTENIEAVGVYYLYIDDKLEGGALKFRPALTPSKGYAATYDIEINRYLMPKTDSAITFNNILPHRFCSIRNSTSIARRRTFLNFFIVSPHYPINALSIKDLPLVSYEQCLIMLKNIENEYQQQKLPDLVIEKILSFLKNFMWQSDIDAKEFRSRVKNEMTNEKSGWSGIQYGNEGDIAFIKSKYDFNLKEKRYSASEFNPFLAHTESE